MFHEFLDDINDDARDMYLHTTTKQPSPLLHTMTRLIPRLHRSILHNSPIAYRYRPHHYRHYDHHFQTRPLTTTTLSNLLPPAIFLSLSLTLWTYKFS